VTVEKKYGHSWKKYPFSEFNNISQAHIGCAKRGCSGIFLSDNRYWNLDEQGLELGWWSSLCKVATTSCFLTSDKDELSTLTHRHVEGIWLCISSWDGKVENLEEIGAVILDLEETADGLALRDAEDVTCWDDVESEIDHLNIGLSRFLRGWSNSCVPLSLVLSIEEAERHTRGIRRELNIKLATSELFRDSVTAPDTGKVGDWRNLAITCDSSLFAPIHRLDALLVGIGVALSACLRLNITLAVLRFDALGLAHLLGNTVGISSGCLGTCMSSPVTLVGIVPCRFASSVTCSLGSRDATLGTIARVAMVALTAARIT